MGSNSDRPSRLVSALDLQQPSTNIITRLTTLEDDMRTLRVRTERILWRRTQQDERLALLEDPDAPVVPRPAVPRTPEPHPDEPSAVRRRLTTFGSTCEATLVRRMMRRAPADEQPTLTGVIATLPPAPTTPPSPVDWNAVPAMHPWPHNWHPSVDDALACRSRLQPGGTCEEACDAGNDALYKEWFRDPEDGTHTNFVFIQMGQFLPCARCSDASTATRAITWTWCRGKLRALPVRRFAQRPMDS